MGMDWMDVSSTSCLTNEIEMADSSHWLGRREARFACSASIARRVSLFGPVRPTLGRHITGSAAAFYRPTASIKPAGILTLCLRTKWHNRDKIDYESQKMAVRYLQMPIFLNGKRLEINQCRSPHYKFGEYASG